MIEDEATSKDLHAIMTSENESILQAFPDRRMHYVKVTIGFSSEVDACSKAKDFQKCVIMLMDEM